ncbi:MAG: SDR family oxidoreductase [Cytophagales bacterium]|nr:MAG: SDR family oxidoreductase [Cytophagales bacterium]
MNFNGQVAVITGAASGIGLSIAKKLGANGAKIAVLDLNVDAAKKHFADTSIEVLILATDITSQEQVDNSIAKVKGNWGRVDILVNSAGITGMTNLKSHEVSTDNLQKVFDVNFMASFYTAHAVLPIMLEQNYGRILHIASVAGKEGNAGMLAYSASKAAVIGMTKVQGKEYAETGITVNALAPAVIRTPLVDAMPDAQVKYMTDKIPMKRCGLLSEVADLVAFIVSKENSFTTAFTYDLTGGRATY